MKMGSVPGMAVIGSDTQPSRMRRSYRCPTEKMWSKSCGGGRGRWRGGEKGSVGKRRYWSRAAAESAK